MDNVKIKIVQLGWETYTGSLGYVEFVDGVSTRAVSEREQDFLAAVVSVEAVDGSQVGIQNRLIGGATQPAEIVPALSTQSDTAKVTETAALVPHKVEVVIPHYTSEQLESIAEAEGIAGLRAISTPRGIKGRSIVELIGEIMAEQGERERAAAPVEPEPVADVVVVPIVDPAAGTLFSGFADAAADRARLFQEPKPIVVPPAEDADKGEPAKDDEFNKSENA